MDDWNHMELNVGKIGNGFVASITMRKGYPEIHTEQHYFPTLKEAIEHCTAIVFDDAKLAELLASPADELSDMPF